MRNEFKSIKVYDCTYRKVNYIRESLRFLGFHLSKSNVMEMGVNMLAKSCRAQLEKKKGQGDGSK
ncbi:hypothetical protein [Rufibacter soli]